MAHTFKLNSESLKRKFSIYTVIVKSNNEFTLYVGKTGDNREGCNPIISRCGNHFSYNKIHSQIRNKIVNHEECEYTYVFDHFSDYIEDKDLRKPRIDEINEMERWLNEKVQQEIETIPNCFLVNPYKGIGHIQKAERKYRRSFRTTNNENKINSIINSVVNEISS